MKKQVGQVRTPRGELEEGRLNREREKERERERGRERKVNTSVGNDSITAVGCHWPRSPMETGKREREAVS